MALTQTLSPVVPALTAQRGASPFLRLQSDDRLVSLTRRGNEGAYETLVARYQARLLAFCRHMLHSNEDAEDVLQEVFASAYGAMVADDRPINVRPWLYRIARNRSLNHMRKQSAIGVDSMDIHIADNGTSTADRVHEREEFRELLRDVSALAETQRTALLLREIDGMSYDQISETMDTTVPAVKSLLVRARIGLADAAQSRRMSCDEVRNDLGTWAEGLAKLTPPVRKHVKDCDRCNEFQGLLKQNNKKLAALFPLGPALILQKLFFSHAAGGAGAGVAAAGTAPSALSVCSTAVVAKACAGLATAAIVTGGAIEVQHASKPTAAPANNPTNAAPIASVAAPQVEQIIPQRIVAPTKPVQAVAASTKAPDKVPPPVLPLGVAAEAVPAPPTAAPVAAVMPDAVSVTPAAAIVGGQFSTAQPSTEAPYTSAPTENVVGTVHEKTATVPPAVTVDSPAAITDLEPAPVTPAEATVTEPQPEITGGTPAPPVEPAAPLPAS